MHLYVHKPLGASDGKLSLMCWSEEEIALHKGFTEEHLSACFTMKTKLVYTAKFTC